MNTEIGHRFAYHTPNSEERIRAHEGVRDIVGSVGTYFESHLPDSRGREKALAITKLEEAMFWANAAIAREL